MKQLWLCIVFAGFFAAPSLSKEMPSSSLIGVYQARERGSLPIIFMNSVTTWLHRYEPRLIERSDDHVRMQAKYDYLYDFELFVRDGEFEVRVTLAQKNGVKMKARGQSADLAAGVVRTMAGSLAHDRRENDRWK